MDWNPLSKFIESLTTFSITIPSRQAEPSQPEDEFEYDKVQFVMIFMGVINLTLQIASGYLVILVYKLIKFTDLPQLLSVCFIHLSMAGNLLAIPFNLTLYSFPGLYHPLHILAPPQQ